LNNSEWTSFKLQEISAANFQAIWNGFFCLCRYLMYIKLCI